MSGEKVRTERTFIEGKGHLVREVPVDQPPAAGATAVPGLPAQPPEAVKVLEIDPSAVSEDLLTRILEARGLVAVPVDDHRELLERVNELERLLDHAEQAVEEAQKGEPEAAAAPAKPAARGKKKKAAEPAGDIEAQIAAAQDLDELTAIMKDVQDETLLKLAEARADEIKQGGQG